MATLSELKERLLKRLDSYAPDDTKRRWIVEQVFTSLNMFVGVVAIMVTVIIGMVTLSRSRTASEQQVLNLSAGTPPATAAPASGASTDTSRRSVPSADPKEPSPNEISAAITERRSSSDQTTAPPSEVSPPPVSKPFESHQPEVPSSRPKRQPTTKKRESDGRALLQMPPAPHDYPRPESVPRLPINICLRILDLDDLDSVSPSRCDAAGQPFPPVPDTYPYVVLMRQPDRINAVFINGQIFGEHLSTASVSLDDRVVARGLSKPDIMIRDTVVGLGNHVVRVTVKDKNRERSFSETFLLVTK